MFKQVSEELVTWLSSQTEFTDVMLRSGKLYLFPIVARIENTLPLATYVLGERVSETKDKAQILVTVRFWFGVEKYDQCCEFTDAMTNLIDEAFMLESSSIEYNEESETFYGEVNFNLV